MKAITTMFEELKINPSSTWEHKLDAALRRLGITDQCHGFVIDGDMAIKMTDYFDREHVGSRSVRQDLKLCWHHSDCVCRALMSLCQMIC